MSTVEATSGTTTHPHHPSSAVRDRALALGVLAVLAGIGAIVTAVWDWARDADIPNTLPTMLGITAGSAALAAMVLGTRYLILCRLEDILAARATAVFAARARQLVAASASGPGLGRTEYWQVYNDVLQDLGGIGGDPAPSQN